MSSDRITEVTEFLREKNCSGALMREIVAHYTQVFKNETQYDEEIILARLPPIVRNKGVFVLIDKPILIPSFSHLSSFLPIRPLPIPYPPIASHPIAINHRLYDHLHRPSSTTTRNYRPLPVLLAEYKTIFETIPLFHHITNLSLRVHLLRRMHAHVCHKGRQIIKEGRFISITWGYTHDLTAMT